MLYGPGIASPGLALSQDIVHMSGLYNILTDTEPPRARPGPSRPSSSSGGPPAAARCGGVTNPTTEHRDAVGRSEAQVGECIAHPGLSPGPINRRLRRRAQELVFTHSKCGRKRVKERSVVLAVAHPNPWSSASFYLPSQSLADSRCNLHATSRSSHSRRSFSLLSLPPLSRRPRVIRWQLG